MTVDAYPFALDPGPEAQLVELPILLALCGPDGKYGAGWTYVHGPDFAPDGPAGERTRWSDVVLIERLRHAVARINPKLPPDAVRRVVELVMTSTSPSLIEDHRGFHDLLLAGVPVAYRDEEGLERYAHAQLVDFNDIGNNEFLAVNQLTIIVGGKNRRPDVLLYVNGLPLGEIEAKAPGLKDPARAAVNQIASYAREIQPLYRYVEIVGVTDLMKAVVGTVTTPVEHFAEWKTMSSDDAQRSRPQLELMIAGVFAPARFLELIRDFVLFETDGARTWKVMAKYHQVHAVNAAVESVAEAIGGDRRGGLIWHTQGAGKSYTMVFFANKVRRDERFGNPTIVAVTDRTDLDNQLADTFTGTYLAPLCKQAEEISGGPDSLAELLRVPAGDIVFTTIQKFAPPGHESAMPVLSERENVIVMADEAHRSQYSSFAENITLALPNATRVGFTGTPVEKADRSSRLVFGDYVSIYRMRQAQEDRATVPIYYESQQVPLSADEELLGKVEDVLEDEEAGAAAQLITAWAKLEQVVGAPDRVEKVADHIAEHFTERCEVNAGKGMVVAYSRKVAAALTDQLGARLGDEAVDCVISAQATDPPEISRFRRNKPELRELAKRFRDPDDPLRVVVVKDMWLTGFDAPVLHTLYIDKPMKDHGLLQAIARVNRVFKDKPGGLVVDYIGIGEDLRQSLRAYDDADIDDPVVSAAKAVARLVEKYEVICAQLHPAGYREGELHLKPNVAQLFLNCYELIIASDERTQEFMDAQAALAKWYALARTQPAVIELKDEIKFFNTLAAEVRKVSTPVWQASKEAEQAVRQFMSDGLAAGEILDVFKLGDQERPELSVLSDEFLDSLVKDESRQNTAMRALQRLLDDEIKGRLGRSNQLQAKLFGEQLEAVMLRYKNRQLTSAEVIAALVEIAKKLRDARHRHEQLGLSQEETAFYDALAGGVQDVKADPEIAKLAHELVESIRADLTVDWADRAATEAKIRTKIKRLLRRHGYSPRLAEGSATGGFGGYEHVALLVLDQAKALYRYWPEVDVGDRRFT